MLFFDVRSRNVYENNRNADIMPGEKSDIYVDPTCILQKFADFVGHFSLNCAFVACFLRRFTATGGVVVRSPSATGGRVALLQPNATISHLRELRHPIGEQHGLNHSILPARKSCRKGSPDQHRMRTMPRWRGYEG